MKRKNSKGFTLIELLVVITIIGILAGLAVPAISGALDRAKQTKDVSNARQLGMVLFAAANDQNGVYPTTGEDGTTAAANSVDIFKGLMANDYLTDGKILATNGIAEVYTRSDPVNLDADNVGWDYVSGFDTSSNGSVPLIISGGAITNINQLTSEFVPSGDHIWKEKGVVFYYIGNSAEWVKADNDGNIFRGKGANKTGIVEDAGDLAGGTLLTRE